MSGNYKGFSLIEILVAIMLVGIMATIVVPVLRTRDPRNERRQFFTQLNMLTQLAWNYAIITRKAHQIFFDLTKKTVQLRVETDKKNEKGDPVFELARGYIARTIPWPKQLKMQNFYINGIDEMERFEGRGTENIWFFVAASGLAQPVTINLVDDNDRSAGRARSIGLVLNPFSAQFKEYDTFQK